MIVERYAEGSDFRLLVVGDKLVAAARREPANVIGDGQRTVRELVEIENKNPLRSDGHATSLSFLPLDGHQIDRQHPLEGGNDCDRPRHGYDCGTGTSWTFMPSATDV